MSAKNGRNLENFSVQTLESRYLCTSESLKKQRTLKIKSYASGLVKFRFVIAENEPSEVAHSMI